MCILVNVRHCTLSRNVHTDGHFYIFLKLRVFLTYSSYGQLVRLTDINGTWKARRRGRKLVRGAYWGRTKQNEHLTYTHYLFINNVLSHDFLEQLQFFAD